MVSVQILSDVASPVGDRRSLFDVLGYRTGVNAEPAYDLMPDDDRIAIIQRIGAGSGRELILVQNFFEELRERMGGN